jgi:small-conductance mechanosensitive channel
MTFTQLAEQFYRQFQRGVINYWDRVASAMPRIILGLIVMLLCILLANILYRVVKKALSIRAHDRLTVPFISRVAKWFFIAGAIMFTFNLMGFTGVASGLLAGAGISAFIVGFALKDIGENFLAGFILVFNRNFHIGDVIKIDSYTGKVVSINLRYTQLQTFEGNDVFVPNSIIINDTLVNVTANGLTRRDFTIGIDYGDYLGNAYQTILENIQHIEGVIKDPGPYVTVDCFTNNNVQLRIYFWYNSIEYEKSITFLESEVKRMVKESLVNAGFQVPAASGVKKIQLMESKKAKE